MSPEDNWVLLATDNPHFITYQLTINLATIQVIRVGRLGRFEFLAGNYLYTGSARRNLISRVQRHLSSDKKLRWHVDYLLASKGAKIVNINLSAKAECEWNQQNDGVIPVPGFGASDCRAKCGSHLKYIGVSSGAKPGVRQ